MANKALINLLDWCKRERENLQCQFDALKAGRFKTHSNDGSGWKDTTQDSTQNAWAIPSSMSKGEGKHGSIISSPGRYAHATTCGVISVDGCGNPVRG